ncbi:hypothetical protein Goshw_001841, partial [Gossypium schwendimanii]|nr:hypothetical protein [Gossypium schwendimanii]
SSNISDNDPIDSSLHQFNVNRADLGGDYPLLRVKSHSWTFTWKNHSLS